MTVDKKLKDDFEKQTRFNRTCLYVTYILVMLMYMALIIFGYKTM